MKIKSLYILLFVPLFSFSQEVAITSKSKNWVIPVKVVQAANHVLDSVGSVLWIDTAFKLNDSVVSLRGYTIDDNKGASERMIVKKSNDTLWTTPDPYIAAQYFSCTETDCCLECNKGATACICHTPACTNGKCDERTYGEHQPTGGLSNAIRIYLIQHQ